MKIIWYFKCVQCGVEKIKMPVAKAARNTTVFCDEDGKRWAARVCHACKTTNQREEARTERGYKKRPDIKYHKIKKGYESELIAAAVFASQGFKVKQAEFNGPDLTLEKDGVVITCEVKSVFMNEKRKYVPQICEKRKDDDLIAIVWPDKTVQIEPMKEHFKKCLPSGYRRLQ